MSLRIKYWIQKKLPYKFVRKILVRLFHKRVKYLADIENVATEYKEIRKIGYAYTDKQIAEFNKIYEKTGCVLEELIYDSSGEIVHRWETIKLGSRYRMSDFPNKEIIGLKDV